MFEKVVFNPVDSRTMAIAGPDSDVGLYRLVDALETTELCFVTTIYGCSSPAFSPDGLRLAGVSSMTRGSPFLKITNTVDEKYARVMIENPFLRSTIGESPLDREIFNVATTWTELYLSTTARDEDDHFDFNFPRLLHLTIAHAGGEFSLINDTVNKLKSLRTFTFIFPDPDAWTSSLSSLLSKVYELPSLRKSNFCTVVLSLDGIPCRRAGASGHATVGETRSSVLAARASRSTTPEVRQRRKIDLERARVGFLGARLRGGRGRRRGPGRRRPAIPRRGSRQGVQRHDEQTDGDSRGDANLGVLPGQVRRSILLSLERSRLLRKLTREANKNYLEDDSVFKFVMGRVIGLLHDLSPEEGHSNEDVLEWTFHVKSEACTAS